MVKIRVICLEDIPQCVKVIRSSFATVADEFGFTVENAPRFNAFSMNDEKLIRQFNEEQRPMYACFSDGDIVGYYSLAMEDDGACELNNLCVLPQFRHGGLGHTILEHAFETAKSLGYNVMNLSMVEENKVLRRWYENHGFVHTRTEKFDFFPFTCGYMTKEL